MQKTKLQSERKLYGSKSFSIAFIIVLSIIIVVISVAYVFKGIKHIVSIDLQDGKGVSSEIVVKGLLYEENMPTVERGIDKFTYWSFMDGQEVNFPLKLTSDVKLMANWDTVNIDIDNFVVTSIILSINDEFIRIEDVLRNSTLGEVLPEEMLNIVWYYQNQNGDRVVAGLDFVIKKQTIFYAVQN
ncbi:MAG: hypothetical protein LBU56_02425 [Rickettsiales bacterium]|jgi:hypothetical protein|nr:hypothetical protein [Rickettsiales bacterium]